MRILIRRTRTCTVSVSKLLVLFVAGAVGEPRVRIVLLQCDALPLSRYDGRRLSSTSLMSSMSYAVDTAKFMGEATCRLQRHNLDDGRVSPRVGDALRDGVNAESVAHLCVYGLCFFASCSPVWLGDNS